MPSDQRALGIGQDRHRTDPVAGIVVASDDRDGHGGLPRHARQESVELPNRCSWRRRSIEHIPCNDQKVGAMIDDGLNNLIEDRLVVFLKRYAVEQAADVHVPGMEYPHMHSPDKIYTCNFYMDSLDQVKLDSST